MAAGDQDYALRLDIEKEHYACAKAIPQDHLSTLNLSTETWVDHERDALILELKTYIWKKDHQEEQHLVPATWWDHLKQAHAPAWFTIRWPVVCKALPHIERRMCPHITTKVPDDQHVLWMHCMDKPPKEYYCFDVDKEEE